MTAVSVSLINMKGGVGKTTLAFNLAWNVSWRIGKRVLAVDLDPQANLSQYFLGAEGYLNFLRTRKPTVVDIFEQFSSPTVQEPSPRPVGDPHALIQNIRSWRHGRLDLLPSRLELAWTLKNPTEKAQLLPQFLAKVKNQYDLILIDCAPTESILTTAAYRSSRYLLVPVKPEFLAAIGLPLLARSLREHKLKYENQDLDLAGIVFSDADPQPRREHDTAREEVAGIAAQNGWPIFDNEARHSNSYATGSRTGTPIFNTPYARDYVKAEFNMVAGEFIRRVGL